MMALFVNKSHEPFVRTNSKFTLLCCTLFLVSELGSLAVDAFCPSHVSTRKNLPTRAMTSHPTRGVYKSKTLLSATLASDVGQQRFSLNETSSEPDLVSPVPPTSSKNQSGRMRYKDAYYFNQALNQLAEQAGDFREPVVRRASAAEDMWTDFCSAPEAKWRPDVISFNTVLKAWSKAGQILCDQHASKSTPEHLLDSNIQIYSARDCANRAQDLLDEQERKSDEHEAAGGDSSSTTTLLDIRSYNTVMDAWAKSRAPESVDKVQDLMKRMMQRKIQPDRIAFTSLMEAYAYSHREDRLDQIRKIWSRMETHDDPLVRPNAQTLTILLHAYSRMAQQMILYKGEDRVKVNQLADQAMEFLQKQEDRFVKTQDPKDQPEVMTYTSAMDVLAKVGSPESAYRAERLWQKIRMFKQEDGEVSGKSGPSIYTYTTMISAWARVSGLIPEAVDRIADLIDELWEDDDVYLSHRPFAAALRGYARSNFPLKEEPNKAVLALKTVKTLRDKGKDNPSLRPTLSIYNAALDCCNKVLASHQLQSYLTIDGSTVQCETTALKIAFAILQTMKVDNITPTSETYAKLLMCARNLMPPGPERTKVAESVLLKAKEAGMADKKVLVVVQQTVESSFWHEFCSTEHLLNDSGRIDWDKVPFAWKKNAV